MRILKGNAEFKDRMGIYKNLIPEFLLQAFPITMPFSSRPYCFERFKLLPIFYLRDMSSGVKIGAEAEYTKVGGANLCEKLAMPAGYLVIAREKLRNIIALS